MMQPKLFTAALGAALTLSALADVKMTGVAPSIDGRLDEACWKSADWNGDFVQIVGKMQGKGVRDVKAQTSFAIVADARAVYVGVRCAEPALEKALAQGVSSVWTCDSVELFLSPAGNGFTFYQFAIPLLATNGTAQIYYSEGGNIRPDPYAPEWKAARATGNGEWTAEIEIPLSAFYMTRNDAWNTTWLVNLGRTRVSGAYEQTSWSPLKLGFVEPKSFRKMGGFPTRAAADDVALTDVTCEIKSRRDGKLCGNLRLDAYVREAGDYTLSTSAGESVRVALKAGRNHVTAPCAYAENGRYKTDLKLVRDKTGAGYARVFPVVVDFEEIRVKLTTPQYRDNFYPGQDSSKIVGAVKTAGAGPVKLTLEGPGIPRAEKTLDAAGAFAFETPGFQFGTATLTVDFGTVSKRVPIRKLDKTGRRMSWIEDGRLVVDGKRVFRRGLYAHGYHGGRAFWERTAADTRLALTPEASSSGGSLEPDRVIRGLEAREARKDVVPCREYFDKLDKMIAARKNSDFTSWYISDEPECRNVSPIYLKHVYEYMKEKDPYHVILTSSRAGRTYIDCADWFETHPYIGPHDDGRGHRRLAGPMIEVGAHVDAFDPDLHPDKCVGLVLQMFAYRGQSILNDYPTLDEYLCQNWVGFIHGGLTVNPYAYHDMGDRAAIYEGNCFVNTSIVRLENLLLNAKRTILFKSNDAESARWDLPDGDALFAVVNLTDGPRTVTVKGLAGDFRPFRSTKPLPPADGDARTFALGPYETVVATTRELDAGLPTYQDVGREVARQEYERTHRDNQFLEKYGELAGIGYKLIDGVRDMYAFGASWGQSYSFDFAFTDRPIRFSKIRVYGSNIKEVKLSARRKGEWVPLEAKCTQPEKYLFEVEVPEVTQTVKLRVSVIPANRNDTTEVYEIEAPRVAGDADVTAKRAAVPEPPVEALWSFTASNAQWSAGWTSKAWFGGKGTGVVARADGGFTVSKGLTRCVKYSPAYPWIEFEIDSFIRNDPGGRGYHAWWLYGPGLNSLASGVSYPQEGLYTVPAWGPEVKDDGYLHVNDYNFDIGFRKLRCVKRPPNLLSATVEGDAVRPGSEIAIALDLVEPCEEVSTAFVADFGHGGGANPFAVNGTSKVELKATDETMRHWAARIPVKSCGNASARIVYVKCTVLGGGLRTPILTNFTKPFKSE